MEQKVKKTIRLTLPPLVALFAFGCRDVEGMDPGEPGRGPGQMVGNGDPVSDGNFHGGDDPQPEAAEVDAPLPGEFLSCDLACESYCDSLGLENPVNVGVCSAMWGIGLDSNPIDRSEACRRLYVDFVGRYPTPEEINTVCDRPNWGETVRELQDSDEYRLINRRRWADHLLYNNRAVNVERIFDADDLVEKAYAGKISWDQFATVMSAHPVLVRRYATAGDRAEALFRLFLGRPPYESERADMGRLYALWGEGYWDHPHIGIVPDAYIRYRCLDDNDQPQAELAGECTSILWGYNQLVMTPDGRAEKDGDQAGMMWSGYLSPDEWSTLQLPGRILSAQDAFWEHTVDEALTRMLGYDIGTHAPGVRHELVRYLLQYNGDIRALDFAIATSIPYLQSSRGRSESDHQWSYGPLKQISVEPWIDSIKHTTGYDLARCDHRISNPEDFLDEDEGMGGWAKALIKNSRWVLGEEQQIERDYQNLAQTLGGCPSNEANGRFTTVSILNTAIQESFVAGVCGVGQGDSAVPIEALLPKGIGAKHVLDDETAESILAVQTRLFLGREATPEELDEARAAADQCTPKPCDAEAFARPICFALLSSSEMLFY